MWWRSSSSGRFHTMPARLWNIIGFGDRQFRDWSHLDLSNDFKFYWTTDHSRTICQGTKMKKVLLTGAFGNVGCNTLTELCSQGFDVTAFDVKSKRNTRVAKRMARKVPFKTCWGDLRSAKTVQTALRRSEPDAILHLAAVIAPTAYLFPRIAYDVNVGGTNTLVSMSRELPKPPHFVFASSYSVHGPRNPYRNLSPLKSQPRSSIR